MYQPKHRADVRSIQLNDITVPVRVALALLFALLLTIAFSTKATAIAGGHVPVTLCHNEHTITIDESAVAAHLEHHDGDYLGECTTATPAPEEPSDTDPMDQPVIEPPVVEPDPSDDPCMQWPVPEGITCVTDPDEGYEEEVDNQGPMPGDPDYEPEVEAGTSCTATRCTTTHDDGTVTVRDYGSEVKEEGL